MALRRLSFHRVLHRPILLRQGEREPVLCVLCVSAILASRMELTCWIAAAAVFLCGLPVCRFLAKQDPQFFAVFLRAHRYRRHYPPRSRPYRVNSDPAGGRRAALWALGAFGLGAASLWLVS